MHLWRAGDVVKVDDYLDVRGLRRNKLFQQLLQALIELAAAGSEERACWRASAITWARGGQRCRPCSFHRNRSPVIPAKAEIHLGFRFTSTLVTRCSRISR